MNLADRGRWEVGEEEGRGRLEVVGELTRSEGAVAGPPWQPGPRCGQLALPGRLGDPAPEPDGGAGERASGGVAAERAAGHPLTQALCFTEGETGARKGAATGPRSHRSW